jgi:hypothetical protein
LTINAAQYAKSLPNPPYFLAFFGQYARFFVGICLRVGLAFGENIVIVIICGGGIRYFFIVQ